jgi:hypothetical protein
MTTLYFVDDRYRPLRIVSCEGRPLCHAYHHPAFLVEPEAPNGAGRVEGSDVSITPAMAVATYLRYVQQREAYHEQQMAALAALREAALALMGEVGG